ncbi:MAG: YtxH domain-containing protein [Thermodesulfobacteriota bacterium]|jgi:gas vesicle protein|nr:MAG: YtxH domain-containing protein [Thermodesulfobacteriota bacterium]
MNSDRCECGFAAITLAFVAGGLIGATLGLLFAPRPGVETREKIKERAEEAREKLRDAVETMRDKAEKLAETGKEKYSDISGKVRDSVDKIKEKVSPAKGEAPEV